VIMLELGMRTDLRATGTVTDERLGDEFVDGGEIAVTERTLLPTLDDRHGIERFGTVVAHTGSIAEPNPRPSIGPSTRSAMWRTLRP